jgi:hypothetical protein
VVGGTVDRCDGEAGGEEGGKDGLPEVAGCLMGGSVCDYEGGKERAGRSRFFLVRDETTYAYDGNILNRRHLGDSME